MTGCATIKGWFNDTKKENIEPPTPLSEHSRPAQRAEASGASASARAPRRPARACVPAYADGKLYAASTTGDDRSVRCGNRTQPVEQAASASASGFIWHHGNNSVRWAGGPSVDGDLLVVGSLEGARAGVRGRRRRRALERAAFVGDHRGAGDRRRHRRRAHARWPYFRPRSRRRLAQVGLRPRHRAAAEPARQQRAGVRRRCRLRRRGQRQGRRAARERRRGALGADAVARRRPHRNRPPAGRRRTQSSSTTTSSMPPAIAVRPPR